MLKFIRWEFKIRAFYCRSILYTYAFYAYTCVYTHTYTLSVITFLTVFILSLRTQHRRLALEMWNAQRGFVFSLQKQGANVMRGGRLWGPLCLCHALALRTKAVT